MQLISNVESNQITGSFLLTTLHNQYYFCVKMSLQSKVVVSVFSYYTDHNYYKERAFASQTFFLYTDNKGGSNIRTYHIILFTEFS